MRKLLVPLLAAVIVLAPMQAANAGSKYTVTLALSTNATSINGYVTLTGKVSPTAKKKTVTIERQYPGGSWTKVATITTTSTSKFSKKLKLTKGGPTFFRARKAAGSGHSAGISSMRNISVFRWRYLKDLPNTRTPSNVFDGSLSVNGYTFSSKSFSLHQNEQVNWNLAGKQCTKVRGYIGIDDDSAAGTTGFAFVDKATLGFSYVYEQGLAKGQSARWVHADLGSTVLRFLASATNEGWVAYADFEVYCNS
jgi:hypothetical protein